MAMKMKSPMNKRIKISSNKLNASKTLKYNQMKTKMKSRNRSRLEMDPSSSLNRIITN